MGARLSSIIGTANPPAAQAVSPIFQLPAELRLVLYNEMAIAIHSSDKGYDGFIMSCRSIFDEARVEIPKILRKHLIEVWGRALGPLQFDVKYADFDKTGAILHLGAGCRNIEISDEHFPHHPMRLSVPITHTLLHLYLDSLVITTHHWQSRKLDPTRALRQSSFQAPDIFYEFADFLLDQEIWEKINVRQIIFRYPWSPHVPQTCHPVPPKWDEWWDATCWVSPVPSACTTVVFRKLKSSKQELKEDIETLRKTIEELAKRQDDREKKMRENERKMAEELQKRREDGFVFQKLLWP